MLFNLNVANDTVSWFFFLFFLIIDLYFLIPVVITKTFNPFVELAIPIGISTQEAKTKMETHPVIVDQYNSKLYKFFLLLTN